MRLTDATPWPPVSAIAQHTVRGLGVDPSCDMSGDRYRIEIGLVYDVWGLGSGLAGVLCPATLRLVGWHVGIAGGATCV